MFVSDMKKLSFIKTKFYYHLLIKIDFFLIYYKNMNIINFDKYIIEHILNSNIPKDLCYYYDHKTSYKHFIHLFYLTCKSFNIKSHIIILNLCNTAIKKIPNITNLNELYLYNCRCINNFTNISTMTNLTELLLSQTNIKDISIIPKNIKILGLSYSENIIDFTPLSQLTKLEELDIDFTFISDISILPSSLTKLEINYCYNIDNFLPLQKLTKLKSLNMEFTNTNINKIAILSYLTDCNIYYN
jgi:Leucine-rich repeat (LRR) protein